MANYVLGQYNHAINALENWITPINPETAGAKAILVQTPLDLGVESNIIIEGFEDSALYFNQYLENSKTYYCHCKIKRMNDSIQKFNISLINASKVNNDDVYKINKEIEYDQYIKTINIQQGTGTEWVDVNFIFTPRNSDFNAILFRLTRISDDFIGNKKRTPIIAFLELGEVTNILSTIVDNISSNTNIELFKMGIQSRPGLKMCINREEISIGRTGIYEFKNGEIKINFFSLIGPAINKTDEELKDIKKSTMFLNEVPANRPFDGFTIDYIYDKE